MIELITRTQYKNKNASTARTTGGINIFISYSTIIAAEAPGVTIITSGYYSNTTAHHKTDARRYFNNNQEIEATPEALYKYVSGEVTAEELQREASQRQELITALKANKNTGGIIEKLKVKGIITTRKAPETKNYKNGNRLEKYFYKVEFKYLPAVYYELNSKAIKYQIETRTGTAKTNKYINNVVNLEV